MKLNAIQSSINISIVRLINNSNGSQSKLVFQLFFLSVSLLLLKKKLARLMPANGLSRT